MKNKSEINIFRRTFRVLKRPNGMLSIATLFYTILFCSTLFQFKNRDQLVEEAYHKRLEQLRQLDSFHNTSELGEGEEKFQESENLREVEYPTVSDAKVESRNWLGFIWSAFVKGSWMRLLNFQSTNPVIFDAKNSESIGRQMSRQNIESMRIEYLEQSGFSIGMFCIFGMGTLGFLFFLNIFLYKDSKKVSSTISILNRRIQSGEIQITAQTEEQLMDSPALLSLAETIHKYGNNLITETNAIKSKFSEVSALTHLINETSHVLNSNISEENERIQEIYSLANSIKGEINNIDRNSDSYYILVSSLNVEIKQLDEMIDHVGSAVETSLKGVSAMKNNIESGSNTIVLLANSVSKIEDNSKEMKLITSLIKQISERVNLLALNAAIESARAGAYGRGFSVVAREIGALAQETDKSMKTIESLIQRSIQEANLGHSLVDRSKELYENIIKDLSNLKSSSEEIVDLVALQTQKRARIKYSSDQIDKKSDEIYNSIKQHKSANSGMETQISKISQITNGSLTISKSLMDYSDQLNEKSIKIEKIKKG
ncbi:hypothetical protein A0128_15275 [Leptospira tipperaryensis]|uniref:Methyl-accepting transducer domain-containing protein n=1 Tax=Leptospira tipperaryensis TaxID=2564040 RepID=A0A1D7UZS5_9LEPT|nr:methyl-accepting chemotaxis protein [Leptospira tipperaryensis]AOP35081.1 hypothetical protein A0128_15275 [Leptospira tipperaryensis]